jgi:hypothetical protein
MSPIRVGDRVRLTRPTHVATAHCAIPGEGTVVWIDRTSPNWTLVHVVWVGGGASQHNITNIERVTP